MTAAQLSARMKRRRALLEPRLMSVTRGLSVAALRLSKEIMSAEIYAIPEDRTKKGEARFQRQRARRTGRPFVPQKGDRKWVRTGHLRRSEQARVEGPVRFVIQNSAAYAIPRHEAGKPGRRRIAPERESHWEADMFKVMHPICIEQWHAEVLAILKGATL